MSPNENSAPICAWLQKLYGKPFSMVPFTVPAWATFLELNPWGRVIAHETIPCPEPFPADPTLPKYTADEWWEPTGRDKEIFVFDEQPTCSDVWDALLDLNNLAE